VNTIFFFQAEDGIRDATVTGVQTCALPIWLRRFVALCGMSRTRELFLTAQPVPAARALGWGLIDRVVPKGEVLATATALATEIEIGRASGRGRRESRRSVGDGMGEGQREEA